MKIQFDKDFIEVDEKWSFQNFTNSGKLDIPDNTIVYATVFTHEKPDSVVFRDNMKGVKFYNCHLDNCIIPEGNEIIGHQPKRFCVQNDGNDWLIDSKNKPTMPINYKIFTKLGLPVPLPKDIPSVTAKEAVDLVATAKTKLN